MKNSLLKTIILLNIFFSINASATNDGQKIADFLCTNVFKTLSTYNYDEYFSKDFREALPKDNFQSIIQQVVEATGNCLTAKWAWPEMRGWHYYKLNSESGDIVNIGFSLDPENPLLITGFYITDVEILSHALITWEGIEKRINSLEGNISLNITKFGQEGLNREIRSNEMQPLGSAFKLYVLGALADQVFQGKLSWVDLFPIRNKWKSLPSGEMQDWEEGKMVSVKDFATKMIEISDNTATDHLIHIIGRDEVEEQLETLENGFISKNIPFLTTSELFKLKWGAPLELTNLFLNGSELERRNILENDISKLPLNGIIYNISETPTLIRELEWFASTDDLCRAMESLKNKKIPEIMEILSKNTPNTQVGSNSHWNFSGFKGGSEPGVLTMAYLLQNHNGDWGCVSMAWHNEKRPLNFWIFNDLVKKILKFSEIEI